MSNDDPAKLRRDLEAALKKIEDLERQMRDHEHRLHRLEFDLRQHTNKRNH